MFGIAVTMTSTSFLTLTFHLDHDRAHLGQDLIHLGHRSSLMVLYGEIRAIIILNASEAGICV